MNVLLSIKPEYAEAILRHDKLYEFRRCMFRRKGIERVYLYATAPLCRVVGSFKVGKVIRDDPNRLWEELGYLSAIDSKSFFGYFRGRKMGCAIEVTDAVRFRTPIDPRDIFEHFIAPRSFRYVDGEFSSEHMNEWGSH